MQHANVKVLALALVLAGLVPQAYAADRDLDCKLRFSLSGWSALYQHAEGSGTVTCANGQTIPVRISAKGGGLTVGKSHIENGTGKFTDVRSVNDILGRYAQGEMHVGLVKSGTAQVLTKGNVSLALAGAGEGVDVGIVIGEFSITRE